MKPTLTLDRTLVAVNVDGVVHLMLELTAPDAQPTARPPIDAVVVLDRSGSMDGAPIRAVREATCNLLRLLAPGDRLGVVAFDSTADMVLPLSAHDADQASAAVRSIHTRGSTNLSGGWLKALEMLSTDPRPEALRRIVVLTDGHANAGITDAGSLCGLMASAQRDGVSTSTIGFDDGYDEVFLAGLSDAGAGNAYWCAGPDQTQQVFAAEFEGLASVVAQNISVEIQPTADTQIAVLDEYPMVQVGRGMQVSLGDAYGGERRRVVAMLQVPAPSESGTIVLGELIVRWASMGETVALHTLTIPLSVDASDDPDALDLAPDPAVVEQVQVLRASKARRSAHQSLLAGDSRRARQALKDAVTILEAVDPDGADLVQARADLEELDRGAWTESSTKRLFSTERTVSRGRRSRFDDQQP
jgi:Ca-activated chloride channel family protein